MRISFQIVAVLAAITSVVAHAEITFEGIFKIEKNKSHIGYAIQRVEIDDTKKRSITLYIKTMKSGKTETTISRSYSDEEFLPLNSLFSSDETGVHESINSAFGGPSTIVNTNFDKSKANSRKDELPAPEGTFLSSFLFYIVDLTKLDIGVVKNYEAFSEEDGRYSWGKLKLVSRKSFGDKKVLQLDDFFAGESIENFVLSNGDPIGARSDFNKIVTYITSKTEAVKDFDFPQVELTEIFKDLPEGTKNPVIQGKLDARKIIESFVAPILDTQNGSEDNLVSEIKVPVKRGK